MTRLLVFGDSIAWGAFDYEKQGWVNRLREYFENNNINLSVYNCANSGETTDILLQRLEIEVKCKTWKGEEIMLMFAYGTNDFTYVKSKNNYWTLKKDFSDNMNKILKFSDNVAIKTFILSPLVVDESKITPTPWDDDFYTYEKDIKECFEVLKQICLYENVEFVDLSNTITKNDLSDGLHPNSIGHQKIFEKIKDLEFFNEYKK